MDGYTKVRWISVTWNFISDQCINSLKKIFESKNFHVAKIHPFNLIHTYEVTVIQYLLPDDLFKWEPVA